MSYNLYCFKIALIFSTLPVSGLPSSLLMQFCLRVSIQGIISEHLPALLVNPQLLTFENTEITAVIQTVPRNLFVSQHPHFDGLS